MIVADDEKFIRQSSIRVFEQVAKDLNIYVNIIEAEDGIETLYIIYKALLKGIKIDFICSDESMIYMKGTKVAEILSLMNESKILYPIPYFLVTAFDKDFLKVYLSYLTEIFSKPLSRKDSYQIIKRFVP